MAAGGSAGWRKLWEAGWQASKASLFRQAAGFFRQGRRAAEASGDELGRVRCLSWEGASLYLAGDPAAALPRLLEAAQTTAAEADPADVYNAMTWAISIAAGRKPAVFIRRLLADGWLHLERLGKESWGHMLHLREGALAFAQGDFDSALRGQQRGWDVYTDTNPRYSRAGHLARACDCAFALRDRQELTRWVEAIEANRPELEEDRIKASLARLLLLRAAEDRLEARTPGAEIARSVLRRIDASEGQYLPLWLPALRALAVFGSHTDVERRLGSLEPLNRGEIFDLRLLAGDFALCRARANLGMEPRDDQWDRDFPLPLPSPPFPGRDAALDHLTAAETAFASARAVAEEEDERLETSFYTRTLDGRLERTRALRRAVEGPPAERAP